jgi:competence protein ComEC
MMPDTTVITSLYHAYLPEPHASFLSGILLGEKLEVSKHFVHAVKITGLLHIVVLSGMNITLLGALISMFTKRLGRKLSAGITIVGICLFVWFVGADPPVTRAAVMGVLALIAIVFERKTLALYILFMSAGIIALVRPEWLTSVSFQLSFGATLGIMLFGNVPQRDIKGSLSRLVYYLEQELRPSLAAQLFTGPIIFWYFKEVSVIAPVSNLAVSFVIAPLMIFGMLTALLGKIHFAAGLLPAYICYGILHYIILTIEFLSRLPYIFFAFEYG